MRLSLVAILVTLTAALAGTGCGGGSRDRVVQVTTGLQLGHSVERVVAVAHPLANGRQAPLSAVAPLIPASLPPRASCRSAGGPASLTIVYASGKTVAYGPDCLPDTIRWLQMATIGEAAQWASPPIARPRIVGATAAEARAMRGILRTLAPTRIRRIGLKEIVENGKPASSLRMTVDAGHTLRGQWEAAMFSRLYNGAVSRLHLRNIGRFYQGDSGGLPGVEIGPPPRNLAPVRDFLAHAGVRVVELRRFATGVELVAQTSDPGAFLSRHGQAFLDALRKPQLRTSVYFAVEDAGGAVVYTAGWLPGEGMSFARPDLDSCGPVMHFGGGFGPQPACPG